MGGGGGGGGGNCTRVTAFIDQVEEKEAKQSGQKKYMHPID